MINYYKFIFSGISGAKTVFLCHWLHYGHCFRSFPSVLQAFGGLIQEQEGHTEEECSAYCQF